MCLAVPGKILSTTEREGCRVARVRFGEVVREAYLDFVPEARVGDYVLVHVGFALSRLDPEEARRTFETLEQAGYVEPAAGSDIDS